MKLEQLEARQVLAAAVTVTTLNDLVDAGDGVTSLREAVDEANADVDATEISFDASLFTDEPATLSLVGGQLELSTSLTIDGPDTNQLTIDAGGLSRIFVVDDGIDESHIDVTLSHLILTGGNVDSNFNNGFGGGSGFGSGDGGAILSRENVTIENATLTNNTAVGEGGAVLHLEGTLNVTDSTVTLNSAGENGGGLLNGQLSGMTTGTINLQGSTISGNTAAGNGGGISNEIEGRSLIIDQSQIMDNSAGDAGGGVFSGNDASVSISNSLVSGNRAVNQGGGIGNRSGGMVTINSSTVSSNYSGVDGGGVGGVEQIEITDSMIASNTALRDGGGIFSTANASLVIASSEVNGNTASAHGGGIFSFGSLSLTDSTVAENHATMDGGGIRADTGIVDLTTAISNSTIYGNTADNTGGGILVDFGVVATITSSTIASNTAVEEEGGGIAAWFDSTTTELGNTIVSENSPLDLETLNSNLNSSFTSLGFNLIGTGNSFPNDAGGSLDPFTQNDLVGVTDPLLGPLQNNGGATRTAAPELGGPAINAGDPSAVAGVNGVPEFDQRGSDFPRVVNVIDIGAVEVPNVEPTISDVLNQVIDQDTSTGALDFVVGDVETVAGSLIVNATSSNQDLVPDANVVLGGSDANRSVVVTPAAGQIGMTTITLAVADEVGAITTDTFVVTVNEVVNGDPTISDVLDQTIDQDTSTEVLAVTIGDAETAAGDLAVSVGSSNQDLVPDANLVLAGSGSDRTLVVTPAADQTGTATITLTVTDEAGATATDTFVLTVNEVVNTDPTISDVMDQSIDQDTSTPALAFTISDAETAVDDLSVNVTSSNQTLVPDGNLVLGGSGADRTVTITPASGEIGLATITLTITDEAGATAMDTFVVNVNEFVNANPTISDVTDQTIDQGASTGELAFTVGDAETDAGDLVVSISSSDPTLVPVANVVQGGGGSDRTVIVTPVANQFGTSTITLTVTDEAGATSAATFVVTVVAAANTAPTVSALQDLSTLVNVATDPIAFTIGDAETASDDLVVEVTSDNLELVPALAVNIFVAGSGADRTVTLTPAINRTGTTTITVTAVDEGGLRTSESFVLTVEEPGSELPVVSISPTGPEGQADPQDLPSGPQPTSWAQQRSSLRELVITLPSPVSGVNVVDVVLTNLGTDAGTDPETVISLASDQLSLDASGTTLTITLDGDQVGDGIYQLELLPSLTGGESFLLTGNESNRFFVLEGDWNGSGGVNIQDFAAFAYWFGQTIPAAPDYIDTNGSGAINIQDFAAFAANFGNIIAFPDDGEGESVEAAAIESADVNGDGQVTAGDALRVINAIDLGKTGYENDSRLDTNRDGKVSSADALYTINRVENGAVLDALVGSSVEEEEELAALDQALADLGTGLF